MGGGSGPGAPNRSIDGNVQRLEREFGPLRHGYFGERSGSSRVRRIASDNPVEAAERFFDLARRGGTAPVPRTNAAGGIVRTVDFSDGSTIGLRLWSSDNSPSLEITPRTPGARLKIQKIHFVRSSK